MSASQQRRDLVISSVNKTFGSFHAIRDVSLTIRQGEFLTLLGPSGSGKTTLLMMIAGFLKADSGAMRLGEDTITALPPEKRSFGMVFQGYALFPHLSVYENVAFPLRVRRRPAAEVGEKVAAALDLVQLGALKDRLPKQLSGGQQQRVALARAMVFTPHLLLLDEPLSALDKKLRSEMQEELKRLHRKVGLTFIYVTHDQDEALSLSDRIVVMRDGMVIQEGAPDALYKRPASAFVAGFLGKSNFLRGQVLRHENGAFVFGRDGTELVQAAAGALPAIGSEVVVGVRPERPAIPGPGVRFDNMLSGTVRECSYFGTVFRLAVDTGAFGTIEIETPAGALDGEIAPGTALTFGWNRDGGMPVVDD